MRDTFERELEQLRLQVELMAVRVGESLERCREVLETGDPALADAVVAADDDIDAMLVSITERAYELMAREAPVASDLRLLLSVLRVLEELERIGDLGLRVAKRVEDQPLLAANPAIFDALDGMAAVARDLFRTASGAWSAQDLTMARTLAEQSQAMDSHYQRLLAEILDLEGPGAAQVAVAAILIGRAFDRIADHTVIIGERLRYLLTGDPRYLAAEVR
ncbi:MAG TPA: phosphate signaling complex protein PhoU [Acidimicrobiales bacterium]